MCGRRKGDRTTVRVINLKDIPPPGTKAVLRFFGVRHSPASFTIDVFVGDRDIPAEELTPDHRNFVGTLAMYGHGEGLYTEASLDRELEPFEMLLDLTPHLRDPAKTARAGTLVLVVKDQSGRVISPDLFRFEGVRVEERS